MKGIRALLGALARGMNSRAAQTRPEAGSGVVAKPPPPYRDGSMLGAFLTETVSYHH